MPSRNDSVRLNNIVRAHLLGAASFIALGVATPVWAADSAAGDQGTSLPTVMVTAQFRSQSVQSTPVAITALSGAELLKRDYTDVSQISAIAPNVTIAQGTSAYGNSATVYIRGIGQYDTNFALEPGVGMYVDDVYYGALSGSFFDLVDLDRVEILRGPQGTLAGKNSIGGAVKLYSAKPTGDESGYAQVAYGSFNRIDVRASFDHALADTLFLRLSGYTKRRDGYVDRLDFACDQPALAGALPTSRVVDGCKIGTLGATKTWGVRANLLWKATDNLEVNIIGGIVRDDSETGAMELKVANSPSDMLNGVPLDSRFVPTRPYINYSTFSIPQENWSLPPISSSHTDSLSGTVDWTLSDNVSVKSITAYVRNRTIWVGDGDASPIGKNLSIDDQPYHQFTEELRFSGNMLDNSLEWTLGGYYFDSRGWVGARVYSAPALNWIQNDPVDSKSKSAFAHVIFHPIERLSVIGGIRYTDDKKSYTFSRKSPDGGVPPIVGPLDGAVGTYAGDSWDYRTGLEYEFTSDVMAYGQFSTGYKGGGINPRPFIPSQLVPFRPERVNAFEIGTKSDLLDNKMRVNVAAFLNKYRDIIMADTNGYPGAPGDPGYFPASAVPFNAGKADIKGIEVETTLTPIEGLQINGSVSYLDFKYKTLDPNAVASGVTTNSVAPFTPKWKWSLSGSYEVPLPGGSTVTPQVDINYNGSLFTDPVNAATNHLPSYTLVNARLAYKSADQNWEATLGVTNLTDKHYYTNAFDLAALNGTSAWAVARPREWYISIRRNF